MLTYSQLGVPAEAQARFAAAERLATTIQPECWVDSLERKLLTAEAREAIDNSATPANQTAVADGFGAP